MFNFGFYAAYSALSTLNETILIASNRHSIISGKEKPQLDFVLASAKSAFGKLNSPHVRHAFNAAESAFKSDHVQWLEVRMQLERIRDAVLIEMSRTYFHQYRDDRAEKVISFRSDWQAALDAFPSAKEDAFAATDCLGLGCDTASVFHSMRVLEHGLRAMAAEVKVTYDVQSWQVLLDQIEKAIRAESKSLERGAEKKERLQFLSEAAKEFAYFKDAWRNHVSHGGAKYDGGQALSVLDHVRSFMITLSSKLSD